MSKKEDTEVLKSRQFSPAVEEIYNVISAHSGITPKELELARRGQTNEPRNMAMYLARKRSGLRLQEIGDEFGLVKYSSVNSVVSRMEQELLKCKILRDRVNKKN